LISNIIFKHCPLVRGIHLHDDHLVAEDEFRTLEDVLHQVHVYLHPVMRLEELLGVPGFGADALVVEATVR
jgi:hypothetical protein